MKEWTFLEAYDYIKANPESFDLCDDERELSGEYDSICVYAYYDKPHPIGYPFAGKLRWREGGSGSPSVDGDLQNVLNKHLASN